MDGWIKYAVWGGGALLVCALGWMVFTWVREWWVNRDEPEVGATEEWADPDTGDLGKIVKAVSFDRDAPLTEEIDMHELQTRLALEDVEIWLKQASKDIYEAAIETLTDDDKWQQYMTPGRHAKKDV